MSSLLYNEEDFEFENSSGKPVHVGQIEQPVTQGFVTIRDFSINDNRNGYELVASYETPKETGNLFKEYQLEEMSLEQRQQLVTEVMMRFDTSPRNYLKDDYYALIRLITHASLDAVADVDIITKPQIDELFIE